MDDPNAVPMRIDASGDPVGGWMVDIHDGVNQGLYRPDAPDRDAAVVAAIAAHRAAFPKPDPNAPQVVEPPSPLAAAVDQHTDQIADHTAVLERHDERLDAQDAAIASHGGLLDGIRADLAALATKIQVILGREGPMTNGSTDTLPQQNSGAAAGTDASAAAGAQQGTNEGQQQASGASYQAVMSGYIDPKSEGEQTA
jgi:hypothetical protein